MDGPAHISLTLPLPPSANKSWRPGIAAGGWAGMFKRAPYKAWLNEAKERVAMQTAGDRVPYRYHLRITLPETARDPDNSVKALSDALQHGGAVADDKHLRRLVLEVDPARDPTTALLEVWALPGDAPVRRARRPKATASIAARGGEGTRAGLIAAGVALADATAPCSAASREVGKQEVPRPRTVAARIGGSRFALPVDKVPAFDGGER